MSRVHFDDKTGERLIEPEVTTLVVKGPLSSILGNRREIHLGKESAYDLAEWLGFVVARPEGMEADLSSRRADYLADARKQMPGALVVKPGRRGA